MGNWVKCHVAVWGADFAVAQGERNLPRKCLGGESCVRTWSAGCSVEALLVDPGYFNHETADKQWIRGSIHSRAIYLGMRRFQGFSFTVWTSIPPLTKLHHSFSPHPWLPHPTNFKTAPRQKQTWTQQNLQFLFVILMVKYCGDMELDMYFISDASKCQGKLQVCSFVCLFLLRVASVEKTAALSCPKCAKCLLHNLRLTFVF